MALFMFKKLFFGYVNIKGTPRLIILQTLLNVTFEK